MHSVKWRSIIRSISRKSKEARRRALRKLGKLKTCALVPTAIALPHFGRRRNEHRFFHVTVAVNALIGIRRVLSRRYTPFYAGVIVLCHPRKLLAVSNIPAIHAVMGMRIRHRKRWSPTKSGIQPLRNFNTFLIPHFRPRGPVLRALTKAQYAAKGLERKKRNFNQSLNIWFVRTLVHRPDQLSVHIPNWCICT